MIVVIAMLAFISGAPALGQPPDPSVVDAMPRPDWYLMWYFAVLALLPPRIEEYLIVYGPLLVGIILIALPFVFNRGERSVRRRPWAVAIVMVVVLMIGTLWLAGVKLPRSPNFKAQPLSASVVGATKGPVFLGAQLFHDKGCLNCHWIVDDGGRRGPDLTDVGDGLSKNQMILKIANGAVNMPAYAGNLAPAQMDALVAFLPSRKILRP